MLLQKIVSLSLLILCSCALFGINDNAGTTGFNNLQIIYSAKAMSMAQAMTGMNATIDGLQFNPAALLNVNGVNVNTTFCSYLVDTNGGAFHLLVPNSEYVTFGMQLHYLNFGQMDRTEITQNNEYLDMGETFGASNIIFGLTAARYINASIDLGFSLKYIYDKIDSYSASAIVIDAGMIHHPFNEKIKVGVAVRNLGTQVQYYTKDKYKEKLPFTFAAGLSYQIKPSVLCAFDISKPTGPDLIARFGLDYKIHPMLNLRAGYSNNSSNWKTGGKWDWSSGLTCGMGFRWKDYALDYGLASYGNLGFINQVSLNYLF
jgi:hypothetical protein